MKINSVSSNHYIQSYNANKISEPEKKKPQSNTDQVTFSAEAMNYSKSVAGIKDQIEVKTPEEKNRIADIKNRINLGQYQIDSELVAEKILKLYTR